MILESLNQARYIFDDQGKRRWALAAESYAARALRLKRLRAAIVEGQEDLCAALYADFQKPRHEALLTELVPIVDELDFAIRHLKSWMRDERVGAHAPFFFQKNSLIREARGRVLIFSPWNYPFQLAMAPLIGALSAGNAVMLKPSDKTPRTAAFIDALISGLFPPEEAAVIRGPGSSVGDMLMELPFDHVFFTGSPEIGSRIAAKAAAHYSSVTLELGGKSPAIVRADADIPQAARRLAWGKGVNAGQTCVAPDYVLAHESIAEPLALELGRVFDEMYGGAASAADSPDLARMVDARSAKRVADAVAASVALGARLAYGGAFDAEARFIAPTVLLDVRGDMPIMRQEIFAPVLPILSFRDDAEAIAFIRDRPKPLALYAFGGDESRLKAIVRATSSGGAYINNLILQVANPKLPFGGVGMSGSGAYHGFRGFKEFSHERSLVREGWFPLGRFLRAPYGTPLGRRLWKLIRLFKRM
jgi:aldehyde dehydrogenase (NAD+)